METKGNEMQIDEIKNKPRISRQMKKFPYFTINSFENHKNLMATKKLFLVN